MLRSCPVQPLSLPENAFDAARLGERVEAGLDDRQLRSFIIVFEREHDERRRLARRVERRIARARVPAKREEVLGLDLLDPGLHQDVLIAAGW